MKTNTWITRFGYAAALALSVHLFAAREAGAALLTATCKPTEVAVFTGVRVHVRCSTATNGIAFFAFQILPGNAAEVDRFVDMTTTALTTSRSLVMTWDSLDVTAGAWGCRWMTAGDRWSSS